MTVADPLPSWPRLHFAPGGGDAFVFYKIHGTFTRAPEISRSKYRCAGVPEGCQLQHFTRAGNRDLLELGLDDGWIGREFRTGRPALAADVARSEECLVLRGTVRDPETLDYFRDAVGLVMALLDTGGTAVFDAQMFKWWSPDEWREQAFEPAGAVPRHHVVILVSDDDDANCRWYHTRGMRKFGRPDLSVHGVAPALEAPVRDLCDRMIEMQAFGAIIPEDQPIKMRSLPAGWRCRHGGELDDPDFNNVHLAIGPA
jgi:hypothetical protein